MIKMKETWRRLTSICRRKKNVGVSVGSFETGSENGLKSLWRHQTSLTGFCENLSQIGMSDENHVSKSLLHRQNVGNQLRIIIYLKTRRHDPKVSSNYLKNYVIGSC